MVVIISNTVNMLFGVVSRGWCTTPDTTAVLQLDVSSGFKGPVCGPAEAAGAEKGSVPSKPEQTADLNNCLWNR